MPKKRPDISKVANELRESAFFQPTPPSASAELDASSAPAPKSNVEPLQKPEVRRRDVVTSLSHDANQSPPADSKLDINQETASHDTLRLAVNETKEIEALKSALKWDHDLTVSKNDICRVALHALLEDFDTNGSQSEAVKRLSKKRGR